MKLLRASRHLRAPKVASNQCKSAPGVVAYNFVGGIYLTTTLPSWSLPRYLGTYLSTLVGTKPGKSIREIIDWAPMTGAKRG